MVKNLVKTCVVLMCLVLTIPSRSALAWGNIYTNATTTASVVGTITKNDYGNWSESAGTSFNRSVTITAGSNAYIAVSIINQSASDNVTAVTYNGVALSPLYKRQNTSAQANEWQYWYGLGSPSTGSNTLAMTCSVSCTPIWSAWGFTGMSATQPNASNGKNAGAAVAFNISVTSTVAGTYVLMNSDDNNGNMAAGADTTKVSTYGAGLGQQRFEYTGSTAVAGKYVLNTSGSNGGAQDATVVALAPASTAGATTFTPILPSGRGGTGKTVFKL